MRNIRDDIEEMADGFLISGERTRSTYGLHKLDAPFGHEDSKRIYDSLDTVAIRCGECRDRIREQINAME